MADIAQRLGQIADGYERDHNDDGAAHWFRTAKAEIERLRAREKALVGALWPFAEFERQLSAMFNMLGGPEDSEPDEPDGSEVLTAANGRGAHFTLRRRAFRTAHAARQEPSHG